MQGSFDKQPDLGTFARQSSILRRKAVNYGGMGALNDTSYCRLHCFGTVLSKESGSILIYILLILFVRVGVI